MAIASVIVGHASISFMVTPVRWAIQDDHRHLAFDVLAWVIRGFVMPLFFWLSGFFSRAVLESGGVAGFVRSRAARVLLPLALALVPCSLAVDALWDWGHAVSERADYAAHAPRFVGSDLPITLGYLWYLYYLLAFSAAAIALASAARRLPVLAPRGLGVVAIPWAIVVGVLAVLGTLSTDTPLSFVVDPPIAAYMGAFFLWGWFVHARRQALDGYARHAWRLLALAAILLAPCLATLHAAAAYGAPARAPAYAIAASGSFSVATVAAILGLCVRHARRPSRVVRLAAESSYWVYIAHFPLLVALQIALARVALPAPVKLVAIVAITTLVSLASYELLVRRTALRRIVG